MPRETAQRSSNTLVNEQPRALGFGQASPGAEGFSYS
ncbi:hypothetical protein ABIA30_002285 [Mycobacterium sp. MAA66]